MPRLFHSPANRRLHSLSSSTPQAAFNDGQLEEPPAFNAHQDFPNFPTFSDHLESRTRGHAHNRWQRRPDHEQHAGAEPGVNPRSGESISEYSHFKQRCVIQIVDYDAEEAIFQNFTNESFIDGLKKSDTVQEDTSLPPRMVRWINIGGIDWGVLSAIALRYNLHSLALEDILHERGHTHSKADYYPGHLFIRVLCHTLDGLFPVSTIENGFAPHPNDDNRTMVDATSQLTDAEEGVSALSPDQSTQSVKKLLINTQHVSAPDQPRKILPSSLMKRLTGISGLGENSLLKKPLAITTLTEGDRVRVNHEPMFIFLLRDGTVISIHPTLNLSYTLPIVERLHRSDSVLRTSEDASLLVESLVDLVVDRILEVVDEYQVKLDKLEHDILLNPVMDTVRSLHIMSGDLILHKRTLEPIRTMVYGLRRHDLERSIALADTMALELGNSSDIDSAHEEKQKLSGEESLSHSRRRRLQELFNSEHFPEQHLSDNLAGAGSKVQHSTPYKSPLVKMQKMHASWGGHKVEGYFSYKSKVYLADVSDHMDFALTSVDMFAGVSENLINYAFNVASYEMNIVMNRLTLATIIFLPLTLLTGYFGMNFTPFWSVDHNSDVFFWTIAIPVMVVLVPVFMYDDIRKVILYTKRKNPIRGA